jgi:predicted heme/steroid binding protein
MKHWLAALSASVAISLSGCSDKAPDTTPVDTSKPAITASAPVNQALDTTQIKVVQVCAPQNLKTPLAYKEQYAEEYKEWLKGCDPEIQTIMQASTTWKEKTKDGSYSDFQSLTYAIEQATKAFQLLAKLDTEWQTIIRNSATWEEKTKDGSYSDFQSLTYAIEQATKAFQLLAKLDTEWQTIIRNSATWEEKTKDGSYSDFQSLTYAIEKVVKLMDLLKKDPSLKGKLTWGTKIVLKDKLYMYGVHANVESAEVRIPTWQEVLDGKAALNIAIGAMQDK